MSYPSFFDNLDYIAGVDPTQKHIQDLTNKTEELELKLTDLENSNIQTQKAIDDLLSSFNLIFNPYGQVPQVSSISPFNCPPKPVFEPVFDKRKCSNDLPTVPSGIKIRPIAKR